jgi:hypothetical protein
LPVGYFARLLLFYYVVNGYGRGEGISSARMCQALVYELARYKKAPDPLGNGAKFYFFLERIVAGLGTGRLGGGGGLVIPEVAVTHPLAAMRSRGEMREIGSFIRIAGLLIRITHLTTLLAPPSCLQGSA